MVYGFLSDFFFAVLHLPNISLRFFFFAFRMYRNGQVVQFSLINEIRITEWMFWSHTHFVVRVLLHAITQHMFLTFLSSWCLILQTG